MTISFTRRSVAKAAALAALVLGTGPCALAQHSLKQGLVGTTWALTSAEMIDSKGAKRPLVLGGDMKGHLALGSNGRYSYQVIGAIPRFPNSERLELTAEQNAAVAQGVLSHFGTYTIDEADQSITFNMERSSNPNQNGRSSKRKLTLKGNELVMDNPARASGGQTKVVWKKE